MYAATRIHSRLSHNCEKKLTVLGQKQLGFARDLPLTFDCRVCVNIKTRHPRLSKSELPRCSGSMFVGDGNHPLGVQ